MSCPLSHNGSVKEADEFGRRANFNMYFVIGKLKDIIIMGSLTRKSIFKTPSNVQKLSRPSVCHQVVSLKAEKTNQEPAILSLRSSEWSKSCILERRFKSIVYIWWNTPNFPSLKSWMQSMRHQKITHFLMDRACMH